MTDASDPIPMAGSIRAVIEQWKKEAKGSERWIAAHRKCAAELEALLAAAREPVTSEIEGSKVAAEYPNKAAREAFERPAENPSFDPSTSDGGEPALMRFLTANDPRERDAAYLQTYAQRIRAGIQAEIGWEIPNTRAATLEGIAKRLLAARDPAVRTEKE